MLGAGYVKTGIAGGSPALSAKREKPTLEIVELRPPLKDGGICHKPRNHFSRIELVAGETPAIPDNLTCLVAFATNSFPILGSSRQLKK